MATKRKAAPNAPKRKLGERVETITIKLTPMQIEDERAKVIELLQEEDELDEKHKATKADYKARIAEVKSRTATSLGMIRSGKTSREVVIEEWVTDQNEVVRVDKATREEIGRRNATAAELQEELPLAEGPDEDNPDDEVDRENAEDFGEKA